MTQPNVEMLAKILQSAADRGFGEAVMRTNLATRSLHTPLRRGANNLLDKAVRATAGGDQERADRLVVRLLGLDYDEFEECDTALHAAHMGVYTALTDLLEQTERDHDTRWLDAAETVLKTASDGAREHLLSTLHVVDHDYTVSKAETARIKAALKRYPAPRSDDDTVFLPPDAPLPEPERERYVRTAIEAVVSLTRAYEALST